MAKTAWTNIHISQRYPKGSLERGAGQHGSPHHRYGDIAGNPKELIGGVKKYCGLRALHHRTAGEKGIDVAAGLGSTEGQLVSFAGQSERCKPGTESAEQQIDCHGRGPSRGVVHSMIMAPPPRAKAELQAPSPLTSREIAMDVDPLVG